MSAYRITERKEARRGARLRAGADWALLHVAGDGPPPAPLCRPARRAASDPGTWRRTAAWALWLAAWAVGVAHA